MPGAAVTESEPVGRIRQHTGELDCVPKIAPARGPPLFALELDQS
ncbi:MAG: hypothetical protein ABW168_05840 [Sedimenticola sp.]